MSKMKKVVRVEMHTSVSEDKKMVLARTYVDGSFRSSEVITRTTIKHPAALLECGHWRLNDGVRNTDVRTATRLVCFKCERIAFDLRQQESTRGPR